MGNTDDNKEVVYTSKTKSNQCKNEKCKNERQHGSSRCAKCATK